MTRYQKVDLLHGMVYGDIFACVHQFFQQAIESIPPKKDPGYSFVNQ